MVRFQGKKKKVEHFFCTSVSEKKVVTKKILRNKKALF